MRVLPEAKTYLPGPGYCIYCEPQYRETEGLRREHIIAHKLGGGLILRNASCRACERIINKEIETPCLALFWSSPRAHLKLPTSKPKQSLRYGRWKDNGEQWPDMGSVEFRFDDIPIDEHPFRIMLPRFDPPGILWGKEKVETFQLVGMEFYDDRKKEPANVLGERGAEMHPFNPEIVCRMLAKIAHGAAVAEYGSAFSPLLPDLIMGRSKYLSHLVGSSLAKRANKSQKLHEITLELRRGYIVAKIQLFSKFGLRPYLVVVGRPDGAFRNLHSSALLKSSNIPA